MTDEEMQKKMEFIIEQQAQFAADIQKLSEAQVKAEERMGKIEGAVVTLVNMVGKLTEAQERTDSRLGEWAEAQARMNSKIAELAEAQLHTDERLNAFILVVERYISEGRNGKSQG